MGLYPNKAHSTQMHRAAVYQVHEGQIDSKGVKDPKGKVGGAIPNNKDVVQHTLNDSNLLARLA